ncbi:KR domain-containing protein [Kribbella catacumbae]|uniref:KR domain-containing protein n=1 Tax=Kribbella catacumbae TaxID=460086 RepID=UPI0003A7F5F8|nr:KR domain-containing protein [Kribbella catacumbae]
MTPLFRWYPVDAPAPGTAQQKIGRTLVLGGDPVLRSRVRDRLAAEGVDATAVDLPDDGSGDELVEAARALLAEIGPVDGIVDLGVAAGFALSAKGTWQTALRQTVAVLKAVYDDWAAETDANRLFYLAVTTMGGRMGYDGEGVDQPLGGIWAGLAKSLPQELPNCRVKVLDLAAEADPAQYILRELRTWDLFEIGWRAEDRSTLAAGKHVAGPARLDLSPADTVLLSGGGRGLGFALARELAGRFGCRILVSGRHPLPYDEEWAGLSDDEFERRERDRLINRQAGSTVREIRADTERRRARREALHNLEEAGQRGLPIEYHPGDITDPAFTQALLDSAGPSLRVVIHNAGVAAPTRLRNKTVDSFLATIQTKVDGFVALLAALGDRRVDYFCNVGSVSGRLGGMIGQIDYAAANEALTRMGFWAGGQGQPVTTICWPTWQRLGLIANFDAALRYADAMPVAAGLRIWTDQIEAAEPGEVMVLGGIGRAVSPGQLKGFANFRDHPDTDRLQSLGHYLGEVEVFEPFRSIRSRTQLAGGTHPCLTEFTVAGDRALPVSVVLEYALSVGDWVTPEGFPELWLSRFRDVVLSVPALVGNGGGFELVKAGSGRKTDDTWEVTVSLVDGAGRPVLRGVAEYESKPPLGPDPVARQAVARQGGWEVQPPLAEETGIAWSGVLYRPPRWRCGPDGQLAARVDEVPSSDEWTLPVPPSTVLPHAAIEAILRARTAQSRSIEEIRIAELGIGAQPIGSAVSVVGSPDRTSWQVIDDAGQCMLTLNGLEVA